MGEHAYDRGGQDDGTLTVEIDRFYGEDKALIDLGGPSFANLNADQARAVAMDMLAHADRLVPRHRAEPTSEQCESFRDRVQSWLDDADTWDDWPKVEAAILGVLGVDTHMAERDEAGGWLRGYRAAANDARRAIGRAFGLDVTDG